MQAIRFLVDFFSIDGAGNSFIKYLKGKLYPSNAETTSQVMAGAAEVVEVQEQALAGEGASVPQDAPVMQAEAPVVNQ